MREGAGGHIRDNILMMVDRLRNDRFGILAVKNRATQLKNTSVYDNKMEITGTKPAPATNIRVVWWNDGNGGLWTSSSGFNMAARQVLYRQQVGLVNLSDVSGADISAKINNLYAAHDAAVAASIASRGRFNDDSWTAPDTLLAA